MKFKQIGALTALYLLIAGILLAAAYYGSMATSVIAQKIPVPRDHTVIIDPGHGGEDGGATSCTGRLESTYNLEIALRLRDLLHLLGYDTVMVRTTDRSVYTSGTTIAQKKVSDLKERVRLVRETDHALLVSIHQNTFPDGRYSGAQVFYGMKGDGQVLGTALQDALVRALNPGSNRKSKPARGIYLMEKIPCTGVLVECGFLSNAEEEAKLRNTAYQQKLCCVIASVLAQHLEGETAERN